MHRLCSFVRCTWSACSHVLILCSCRLLCRHFLEAKQSTRSMIFCEVLTCGATLSWTPLRTCRPPACAVCSTAPAASSRCIAKHGLVCFQPNHRQIPFCASCRSVKTFCFTVVNWVWYFASLLIHWQLHYNVILCVTAFSSGIIVLLLTCAHCVYFVVDHFQAFPVWFYNVGHVERWKHRILDPIAIWHITPPPLDSLVCLVLTALFLVLYISCHRRLQKRNCQVEGLAEPELKIRPDLGLCPRATFPIRHRVILRSPGSVQVVSWGRRLALSGQIAALTLSMWMCHEQTVPYQWSDSFCGGTTAWPPPNLAKQAVRSSGSGSHLKRRHRSHQRLSLSSAVFSAKT